MSDFQIKLNVHVDGNKAETQMNDLIKKLEEKKINVKFNIKDLQTQLQNLNKFLNDAFKLDNSQIQNLNQIKSVLTEINKLSRDVQKNLFGGNKNVKNTQNVKELSALEQTLKKYDLLKQRSESIQKQMSKTVNTQSYDVLQEKLTKVHSQMQQVAQDLSQLGVNASKTDITRSLASSFDSIQEKAKVTAEQINNLFKNKNLTNDQINQLNNLKQKLSEIQNTKLDNIVKSKTAYEDMHKLYVETSNLKIGLKELSTSLTFTDQIKNATNQLTNLTNKLNSIKTSKFIDSTGVSKLETDITILQNKLQNLNPNTETAKSEFDLLQAELEQCIVDYTRLQNVMKTNQSNAKFGADYAQVEQQLLDLTQRVAELGASSSQLDIFRDKLQQIANITNIDDRARELNILKTEMSTFSKNLNFTNDLNKSMSAIDSLLNKLRQMKTSQFADTTGVQNLELTLKDIQVLMQQLDPNTEQGRTEFEQLKQVINQCETEYKELQSVMSANQTNFKFQADFKKTEQDIKNLTQRCKELGMSTSEVELFARELQRINSISNLDDRARELAVLRKNMSTFKSTLSSVGKTAQKTNTFCNNLYSSLMMFSAGNIIGMQLTKAVSAIKDTIIDLDSAFRDLMKVAPDTFQGTADQLDALRQKASEVGQDVARSSVDIINSTASALQAGFKDVDKAMEYAKNVNIFANVAVTKYCLCS